MRGAIMTVPAGDLYGLKGGLTSVDLTNPTFDTNRDGEVDDVQRGEAPFPRAVIWILGLFGALVVAKFVFEKLS